MTIEGIKLTGEVKQRDLAAVKAAPKEEAAPESGDKVTLSDDKKEPSVASKILNLPRKAVGAVVGTALAAADGVANVLPGAIFGGFEGVAPKDGSTSFAVAKVGQFLVGGAVAGGLIVGGPLAIALGAVGGGVLGIASLLPYSGKDGERFSASVENRVADAVKDNVPTGIKRRDVSRNFAEGVLTGGETAVREGTKMGYHTGTGVTDGVFEGIKGAGSALVGAYQDAPAPKPAEPDKSVWQTIASIPKKIIKTTVGLATGTVGAALTAAPGTVQGLKDGYEASRGDKVSESTYRDEKRLRRMIILESMAGGAALGFTFGTPLIGTAVGAVGGLITGVVISSSMNKDEADERIAKGVAKSIEHAAKDNEKTSSDAHDIIRGTIEGGMTGTVAGAREGFKEGFSKGAKTAEKVVDNLNKIPEPFVEGIKGAATALVGKYEKPSTDKPPAESIGHKILTFPKKVVQFAVGVGLGTVEAALTAPSGLMRGIGDGIEINRGGTIDESYEIRDKARFHRRMVSFELALGGAAAGFIVGGPVGAGVGFAGGILAGYTHGKIEKATNADNDKASGMTEAIKYAAKDNKPTDSKFRQTARGAVEGGMTGAAAGIREGFKEGYQAGKGLVDGVIDTAKGIAKGIKEGVTGKLEA
jgi:flagellar biosynthesis/type III secretory pathway protein FliH